MLTKKFKNLIQAFNNAYIYDELLNAKDKLNNLNILILKRERELNDLDNLYNENKKNFIYSFFNDEEILDIKKKNIEDNLYYIIERFNRKIEEELDLQDKVFKLFIKNPCIKDIISLHILSKKINKGKNFISSLGHIKNGNQTNFYSWKEVSLTVKVVNQNLDKKLNNAKVLL